jgi:NADH dehydrogenase (ubiquinone) 1 beta subcomplex subunit 9
VRRGTVDGSRLRGVREAHTRSASVGRGGNGKFLFHISVQQRAAMGAAASMPAARAGAWKPGLTHAQRVTRLYRASLRNSRDWSIDYDVWIVDCQRIQARFVANKHKSLAEGRDLVEAGMRELFEKRHPDPYIPIYAEGSSKYQRNVPPPPEVRIPAQYCPPDVPSSRTTERHRRHRRH